MSARDTLTLVHDARGRVLTKRYELRSGELVKSNYPNVAEVIAVEVPVDGIGSLAAALDRVVSGGVAAVIRGAPAGSIRVAGNRHSACCARKKDWPPVGPVAGSRQNGSAKKNSSRMVSIATQ